jgi:hypothetical protein
MGATDYQRLPDGVIAAENIGDWKVLFKAADIRRERTGIHATITIGVQQAGSEPVPLEEETYNVARRDERESLVRAIYKKDPLKAILLSVGYDDTRMGMDLMQFQRGLWRFETNAHAAERRGGATTRATRRFIIEPYVLADAGTILFAPPGRGKSWVGMLHAVCVDAGLGWFWPVTQVPTLFVNLERSAESVDVLRIDRRGRSMNDVLEGIQTTIEKEGVQFVVVDSLSRMGYGDMTANDPANKAMDALNSLRCAWEVLAHTPRGDESHTFGSQMFDAAADVTVQLMTDDKSVDDTLGVGLRVDKANDIRTGRQPSQIAFEFDDRGLKAVRKAKSPHEFPEIASARKKSVAEQVREFMNNNVTSDASTIAEELGVAKSQVHTILNSGEYVQVGKEGRRLIYGRVAHQDEPIF